MSHPTRPDDANPPADPRAHAGARASCPPPSPFSPEEVLGVDETGLIAGFQAIAAVPAGPEVEVIHRERVVEMKQRVNPHRIGPDHYATYYPWQCADEHPTIVCYVVQQGALVEFRLSEFGRQISVIDLCSAAMLDQRIHAALEIVWGAGPWVARVSARDCELPA